jgi:hypothetical protein
MSNEDVTQGQRAGGAGGIAVIGGWVLLLTWPLLFGGRVLYWGTQLLQFAPWRQLVVDALGAGNWPLWTQVLGNGAPLLANHQSAVFYPPHLIFLLFPVERALGYSLALHLALAGLFAWLWARQLGLGSLGRLVAGLTYAGSGFLVGRALFPSMVETAAWLPLLFLLADRLVKRRRASDALALGATLGVQLLAGHAQLWYYGLWAVAAYALFVGWQAGRPDDWRVRQVLAQRVLLVALAVAVAIGAAAVQVLPTGELAMQSQRSGGADWDFAMTYSLWPWRLLTLLAPDFFGNPADGDYWGYGHYFEDNGYVGLLPLILAGLAVARWLRRGREITVRSRRVLNSAEGPVLSVACSEQGRGVEDGAAVQDPRPSPRSGRSFMPVPFLVAMTVAALLLALGENTPAYPLVFRYVPGFGAFQAPARFLYLYTFAVATLAGIGAHGFRLSYATQYVSRLALAGGVTLAILAWIGYRQLPDYQPTFTRSAALTGGLLVLSVGTLLLRGRDAGADARVARSPLPRRWWPAVVVGLVAGDLLLFGRQLNPTTDPSLYHLTSASGDYVRAHGATGGSYRIFSFDRDIYDALFEGYTRSADFGPTDLGYLHGLRETLLPNLAVLEGLESANNYEPLLVSEYADLIEVIEGAPLPDALRLLGLMNVRYIVSRRPLPDMTPVYKSDSVRVYDNPYVLPRARVVYRARTLSDPGRLLAELVSSTFDPASEVLLSAKDPSPHLDQTSDIRGGPPTVRLLRCGPNQVTISAALSQPGYLVLAQTFYPGWQVRVDGVPSRVLRANYAFCAVRLDAGEHHVAFEYRPLSFYAGLVVSGLTWAALALLGVMNCRRVR